MKKLMLFLGLVGFAALSTAACGGNDERAVATTAQATSAVAEVPFDSAFIDAMVPHHQAAIEMAREAKKAGLSEPDLVEIADKIIASQRSEIDQMLAWRQQWFGSKKPGPEDMALQTLGLSAAEAGMEHHAMDVSTADDVDRTFAEMMIVHHEGAIRMARLADEHAGHGETRELARAIIAAQEHEIEIMEEHAHAVH